MKRLSLTLLLLAGLVARGLAQDFQSGDLLYSVISLDPPQVCLDGHVDGTAAQGALNIPETVTHNGMEYTVKTIGKMAFYSCFHLTGNLVIPGTVTLIDSKAFTGCWGLTGDLVIPESVIEIKDRAFWSCYGFSGNLVIPESVKTIGEGAFCTCTGLTGQLVIPNSITEISPSAFSACENLTGDLVIPDNIVKIGNCAFRGCTGLDGTLHLGESLKVIANQAFKDCSGLHGDLTIPETVTFIGREAFYDCSGFDGAITLPDNLLEMQTSTFLGCSGLTGDLVIPDKLTTVIDGAFLGCSGLNGTLVIPESIITIGWRAFQETNFSNVIIGSSVEEIGCYAFMSGSIGALLMKPQTPPQFGWYAFHEISPDIPITVPCGSLEAYQNAQYWNEFTNYQEGYTFSLAARAFDDDAGMANILQEPSSCDDLTAVVEAIPLNGSEFLHWEINGVSASTDNPYTFTLEGNTVAIAHFSTDGVAEMPQGASLFPNPTAGLVRITGEGLKSAEVTNALGQRVATAKGEGDQMTIDIAHLPTGLYFVSVTDEQGRKCVRKVVKE